MLLLSKNAITNISHLIDAGCWLFDFLVTLFFRNIEQPNQRGKFLLNLVTQKFNLNFKSGHSKKCKVHIYIYIFLAKKKL